MPRAYSLVLESAGAKTLKLVLAHFLMIKKGKKTFFNIDYRNEDPASRNLRMPSTPSTLFSVGSGES